MIINFNSFKIKSVRSFNFKSYLNKVLCLQVRQFYQNGSGYRETSFLSRYKPITPGLHYLKVSLN